MTRRQLLWLMVWILAFFMLYCTWDKSNKLFKEKTEANIIKPAIKPAVITEVKEDKNESSVIENIYSEDNKKQKESKSLTLEISKDDDSIKIKGEVPTLENKSELRDNFMQFFTHIDDSELIVDENVKEDLFAIDLFESLAEDFARFDSGDILYDGKSVKIDGVTTNSVAFGSIKKKSSLLTEKGLDVNNSLKLEDEPKYSDEDINSSEENITDIKKDDENNSVEDKKRASQEEIDTLMRGKRVEFLYAKDVLSKKSKKLLDEIVDILKENNSTIVEIQGYTDSDGTSKRNLKLSQRRADTVKRYLIKRGISKDRLKAIGYGETNPIVPNTTKSNKQKNRRVEFKIVGEIK